MKVLIDRAIIELALEALDAGVPISPKSILHDWLRVALAQQAEMADEYRKGFIAGQIDMRDREEKQNEPIEPVDVGLLEYRGNSVAFIHQKMTAYRTGIDAAWDAFRANGLHPDGKTSLADMIVKYTAPPQRKE